MKNLVSIIIPIYNAEEYLDKCINSVIDQNYKQIEIILVNDGSTDGSLKICQAFSKKDSRIKVVSQANGGLSAARNTGMKVANGEFYMFVDGDDFVSSDFCKSAIFSQQKYNSDIVIFDYKNIYPNKFENYSQNIDEGLVSKKSAMELIINDSHAWNKLYRSNLFNNIEYPIGRNYEDILTTYKLVELSNTVSYIAESTYFYVHRENVGISVSRSPKNMEDLFYANLNRFNFYKKNYPDVAATAEASLVRFAFLFLIYRNKKSNRNLVSNAKRILKNKDFTKKLDFKHRLAIFLYNLMPYSFFCKFVIMINYR